MPRQKKQENAYTQYNPSSKTMYGFYYKIKSNNIGKELNRIEIPIIKSTDMNDSELNYKQNSNNFNSEGHLNHKLHSHRGKLSFKKANLVSKFRTKEKTSRVAKNIKNMMQDPLDNLSFNLYQGIEAGPSFMPKKKYCDITGFESTYSDPKTGLRYYNSEIFKIIQNLSEPVKNQYLSLRKALFIIK